MDIESRRSLWDRIGQLAASGKAILLTTHYLEEAEALASRVVLLNQGRIAAEGSPSQIKETVHRQTIRCTTSLDPAIVRSLPFVTGVRADHGRLVVETTQADSVVREMLGRDSGICNIEIAGAALEDAVLELTRKTSTHPAND
jgi:ABC-2 type transport system ATP-binding protein